MQKSIPLNKLKPNPFRNMARYPIDKAKVATLRESYKSTGYWGNILGREIDGDVEIAYGHHRLIALREEHGENSRKAVEIIIQPLTDEEMLKIMASENMEEWGTNALVAEETVRATIEAFAAGKIKLPEVPKKTPGNHLRVAPSFVPCGKDVPQDMGNMVYTMQSLGQFLGWLAPDGEPKPVLRVALETLKAEELKVIKPETTAGLSRDQARVVTGGAMRIRRSYEAAAKQSPNRAEQLVERGKDLADRFVQDTARDMKEGKVGVREAESLATQMKAPKPKAIPDIEVFADKTAHMLNRTLDPNAKLVERLNALVTSKANIPRPERRQLVTALTNLSKRAKAFCKSFQG